MCGIFAAPNRVLVEATLEGMRARGPDERHLVATRHFCVGFSRLAFVGGGSGYQPYEENGRIYAFAGEIYNWRALSFEKSEVAILARARALRLDPRSILDGDYAVLEFDPSSDLVTLWRDRFGASPLYYQLRPFLAVSSEAKYLHYPVEVKPYERVRLRLNRRSANKAGKLVSKDRFPIYGLTRDGVDPSLFAPLLMKAVGSRALHSDDQSFSAVCSGGLDSAAVCFALKQASLTPECLLCVSIGESDELIRARTIAACTGFRLEEIILRPANVYAARHAIREAMDVPNPTSLQWKVAVRSWFTAERSPSRIVLTGDGADELIDAYPPKRAEDRAKQGNSGLEIAARQLRALRSLPTISLNVANKVGLAHGVEFRAPFLHNDLSHFLLSRGTRLNPSGENPGKQMLREYLRSRGCPPEAIAPGKWTNNDAGIDATYEDSK